MSKAARGTDRAGWRGGATVLRLLLQIAAQSLVAHRNKSVVVGGLMAFGAFVVVVSLALLSSVQDATRASIVESISGDLQLYDADARDSLALLGGMGLGADDIGELPASEKVLAIARADANVAAALPMGLVNASVAVPSEVDRLLGEARVALRAGNAQEATALVTRVQGIARVLAEENKKQEKVIAAVSDEDAGVLARVVANDFIPAFAADPMETLDWLDAHLAPMSDEGSQFFLRLIGTDLPLFRATFPRVRIIEGEMVPAGVRGVLVGKSMLDNRIKLPIAIAFDQLKDERNKGNTIAGTRSLQELVAQMQRQSSRLLTLLAPRDVDVVEAALRKVIPREEAPDATALARALVSVTDENFDERYRLFYDVVAPHIQLYPFRVGDTITLTAFTQTGSLRSLNVKVWGIYAVDGLESSDIASAITLTDMMTFRDLYGARDAAYDAEIASMREAVHAKDLSRENAEAELFGPTSEIETVATPPATTADAPALRVTRSTSDTFDPIVQTRGLALTVAVVLRDPARSRQTQRALGEALAPLHVQVVDWQAATGVVGQMSLVVSAVLLVAILILFLVTIVILNNSLVMATLERVAEFGTLRAIGAGRGFVRAMVVIESAMLGVISAAVGVGVGAVFIVWLHRVGLAAPNRLMEVLFGGPRLFPTLAWFHVGAALTATTVVGVAATLYPARLATRVQPIVAMQQKE